jgi:predicted RNA binding protein YcfA (HicA-like mRNA interferase family)
MKFWEPNNSLLKGHIVDCKEVIRFLLQNGWRMERQKGSHMQFKHPIKHGCVTVQQGRKDIPPKTLSEIERQSGLMLRKRK